MRVSEAVTALLGFGFPQKPPITWIRPLHWRGTGSALDLADWIGAPAPLVKVPEAGGGIPYAMTTIDLTAEWELVPPETVSAEGQRLVKSGSEAIATGFELADRIDLDAARGRDSLA